ncbi:MAG: transposase [Candidatus Marinimicrobia bacterium]|nr:transposase [Candidatus Neomarinimicrobiota bacterium]
MRFIKDNYYHIYNRGIDKKRIFYTRGNYLYFIDLLRKYSIRYSISVIAYCLIPNHYHLMLYQKTDIPVSRFVQSLNNVFVQSMNKQLNRKGTLFEGRAKSRIINDEFYLMHISRYIHLNPLKHNLVQNLLDWEFSNYHECIGTRNGELFDPEFIQAWFDTKSNSSFACE